MYKNFCKIFREFILVTSFFLGSINLTFANSNDIRTILDTDTNEIEVGQEFAVNLWLDPDAQNKVFTVSANLVYDPNILELISSFTYPDWFEIKQKDFYKDDRVNGLVVRTAGYPGGFFEKTKFLTYRFKAKNIGSTKISITSGEALNDKNLNVGVNGVILNLSVLESKQRKELKNLSQEYDLNIEIDSDTAFYRQEDFQFTLFNKKESKNQKARTKIWLFDEDWRLHYEDEKLWETDKDTILNFLIPGGTVKTEGNFKIIAKVRYEDGQEFQVAEKNVGVLSNGQTWFTKNSHVFMPIFFAAVVVAALHHIFIEREVYFRLRRLLKKDRKRSKS